MWFSIVYLLAEWRNVAMMRGEVKAHAAMWKALLGTRAAMLRTWSKEKGTSILDGVSTKATCSHLEDRPALPCPREFGQFSVG